MVPLLKDVDLQRLIAPHIIYFHRKKPNVFAPGFSMRQLATMLGSWNHTLNI